MRKTTSNVTRQRPRGKSEGKSRTRSATSLSQGFVRDAKRNAKGHVGLANNLAAKPDGINRFIKRQDLSDDIRAEVERFMAQVVSDQGGTDECHGIRGGYVRNLGTVETLVQLAVKDIRANGMYTDKGRTRQIVFTLMQFLDRWDRYAQRLGLERRAKRVESLEDFLNRQEGAPE